MARVAVLALHFAKPLGQGNVEQQSVSHAPFIGNRESQVG
jgi:hypothetical protein